MAPCTGTCDSWSSFDGIALGPVPTNIWMKWYLDSWFLICCRWDCPRIICLDKKIDKLCLIPWPMICLWRKCTRIVSNQCLHISPFAIQPRVPPRQPYSGHTCLISFGRNMPWALWWWSVASWNCFIQQRCSAWILCCFLSRWGMVSLQRHSGRCVDTSDQ